MHIYHQNKFNKKKSNSKNMTQILMLKVDNIK